MESKEDLAWLNFVLFVIKYLVSLDISYLMMLLVLPIFLAEELLLGGILNSEFLLVFSKRSNAECKPLLLIY